jgi:hypothetical protein
MFLTFRSFNPPLFISRRFSVASLSAGQSGLCFSQVLLNALFLFIPLMLTHLKVVVFHFSKLLN